MQYGRMLAAGMFAWAGCAEAQESAQRSKAKGPKTLWEAIGGAPVAHAGSEGEEDRLEPDRPHFPEASTAVGLGRVMIESGYTFTTKGSSSSHALPEALVRVGMFANWFEFRIAQNWISQKQTVGGVTTGTRGFQDLSVGFKIALNEQSGWFPAIAIIPQTTLPTAGRGLTAGRAMPGVNVDFGWEVVKDLFSVELVVANNLVRDDPGTRHELATGLTGGIHLTKNLEAFVEWDAFYPSSGFGPVGSRHYAVAGLIYFVTPNFAIDGRMGVGLNSRSDDFLAGFGVAARF